MMNQCGQVTCLIRKMSLGYCAGRRGLARIAIFRSVCGPNVMDAGLAIPA